MITFGMGSPKLLRSKIFPIRPSLKKIRRQGREILEPSKTTTMNSSLWTSDEERFTSIRLRFSHTDPEKVRRENNQHANLEASPSHPSFALHGGGGVPRHA